jgi:hypothetical protein
MALAGKSAVIVWNDIAPEGRDAFFEWHARQHMPERINLPGFNRGRRCIAVAASVEFLTLYEVDGEETLDSEIYKTRLANPTAWSLAVMPHFRNNVRGGCRVAFTGGPAQGGFVLTLRMKAEPAKRPRLIEALASTLLPRVLDEPRVTGSHLLVNDPGLSGGQVGQRQGRFITQPEVVAVIEGSTAAGVTDAANACCGESRLAEAGADEGAARDLYQTEYTLQKLARGDLPAPSPLTAWEPPAR